MLDEHFTLPEFCTVSNNIAGSRCGCHSDGPAGDRGGHCHHCGDDQEDKKGLCIATVIGGSCIHGRYVQW